MTNSCYLLLSSLLYELFNLSATLGLLNVLGSLLGGVLSMIFGF